MNRAQAIYVCTMLIGVALVSLFLYALGIDCRSAEYAQHSLQGWLIVSVIAIWAVILFGKVTK